jgi:rubrerythrin
MEPLLQITTMEKAYAHALAIAQEATNRYYEFAEVLMEYSSEATARMFQQLAKMSAEYADTIASKAGQVTIPMLEAWKHSWIDAGPPEAVSRDIVYHMMTPYGALKIALSGEQRARAFFERLGEASTDPDVKRFAQEFVNHLDVRIHWIEEALRKAPRPFQYGDDYEAFVMR